MMMVRQNHKYISKRKKKAIRLRQALMPRNNDLLLRVAKLMKKEKTVLCPRSMTRRKKMT